MASSPPRFDVSSISDRSQRTETQVYADTSHAGEIAGAAAEFRPAGKYNPWLIPEDFRCPE